METALGTALGEGHPELAMALMRVLAEDNAEIRTHYFWPIITHYGKQGDSQSKNVLCGVEYCYKILSPPFFLGLWTIW